MSDIMVCWYLHTTLCQTSCSADAYMYILHYVRCHGLLIPAYYITSDTMVCWCLHTTHYVRYHGLLMPAYYITSAIIVCWCLHTTLRQISWFSNRCGWSYSVRRTTTSSLLCHSRYFETETDFYPSTTHARLLVFWGGFLGFFVISVNLYYFV